MSSSLLGPTYPRASNGRCIQPRARPVIKPLINQLNSSIQGQFQRIEREHEKLKTKLTQNVDAMHRRIWKLKSREPTDDLSNWHSKEDLRHYLTAMSLLGSSKNGGGRTFGKHSFFDNISHFKDTLDAARAKKRENYSKKLIKMGIQEQSKKGQFLWKQMNQPTEGSAGPNEAEKPKEKTPAVRLLKDEEQKEQGNSATSNNTANPLSIDEEPDLTPEEEEALMKLAREDDAVALGQGWQIGPEAQSETDSAALAKLALQRLSASISPQATSRPATSSTHAATGSGHLGIASEDRKVGAAIIAPKQFRKSAEELEEEEEERQLALAQEQAKREAEERRRKEEAEREQKHRTKEAAQEAGRARYTRDTGGSASRRGSLIANVNANKGGSIITSLSTSPQPSRRGSLVGAAMAFKALLANGGRRPLSILPDKPVIPAPSPEQGGLTEEQFSQEAQRIMNMVLANSAKFLSVSSATAQAAREKRDREAEESGLGSSRVSSAASAAARAKNQKRDPNWTLQDEIDEWNARTPATQRSNTDTKSILALAAEKLGVASVSAVGSDSGYYDRHAQPILSNPAANSAAYRSSYNSRAQSAGGAALREAINGEGVTSGSALPSSRRPESATASATQSPRSARRKPITNFGHSLTSTTTNITSINHAIEFKEPKGRKELVTLNAVQNPATLFAEITEGKLGSTLMPFDQLHQANQTLADEQRKRVEAELLARANMNEITIRKVKKRSEKDAEEYKRDRLAEKSRSREWVRQDGSPTKKTLHVSSSTGHLTRKSAHEFSVNEINSPPQASPSHASQSSKSGLVTEDMSSEEFLALMAPPPAPGGGNHGRGSGQQVSSPTHQLQHHSSTGSLLPNINEPTKSLQPSASLKSFLSKSGHDYVHLSPVLIVPKWTDVAKNIDYATLLPGYVPPPPVIETVNTGPQVTHVHSLDEDGFPVLTITTVENGVSKVEVRKGSAARQPPPPLSPLPTASGPFSPGSTLTSPMSGTTFPLSPTSPSSSQETDAKRSRRELDAKLRSQIDEDLFPTPSARKAELKRLRYEASIPSPCQQGPSIFQAQKYGAFKSTYAKFLDQTVDVVGRARGAISTQKIEQISGRKERSPSHGGGLSGSGLSLSTTSTARSRPSTAGSRVD